VESHPSCGNIPQSCTKQACEDFISARLVYWAIQQLIAGESKVWHDIRTYNGIDNGISAFNLLRVIIIE
jgi:hypothetical protein